MTYPELSFALLAVVLALPVVQLLLLAGALVMRPENESANRSMAALLAALAGILAAFGLGFAGLCTRWPVLCHAPLALSFAIGPLIWFYATALACGRLPGRFSLHLLPAGAQFLFMSASLLVPAPLGPALGSFSTTIALAGTLVGLVFYCRASLALVRRMQHEDPDEALRWLGRALVAVTLFSLVRATYQTINLLHPLGNDQLFAPYLAILLIGLYLGVESWRHAGLKVRVPRFVQVRDWRPEGEAWARRLTEGGWHTDPDLSLPLAARRLGTNPTYLSRALNDGLGVSFSDLINRLRAEEVARRLREGADGELLDLALAAGFGSKASFNRAFRAALGTTPAEYRARHGSKSGKAQESTI